MVFNLTTIKLQDKEQNSDILVAPCLLLEKHQKRLPASERKPFLSLMVILVSQIIIIFYLYLILDIQMPP